ncbi:MAG: serine hydrolase domain-containing protein [Acidimicrobiia bacterium]
MKRSIQTFIAAAAVAALAAACGDVATPPPATAVPEGTQRHCALPGAGSDFTAVNPADVGMDPVIVGAVVQMMARDTSHSFRIYRHGCLVGQTVGDSQGSYNDKAEYFSLTKSITSLVVGRAITLGKLSLDDTVAKFFPNADAAHGAITIRELLNDTSGLQFSWLGDVLAGGGDEVAQALSLPVVAQPGTTWAYSQTTFTLLTEITKIAVGQDFQAFATSEVFDKVGISRSDWNWERDAAWHTHGWSWLQGSGLFAARLGQLVLSDGQWKGVQVLSPDYIAAMKAGTDAQPSYGLGVRLNLGDWYTDSASGEYRNRMWNPDAPRDLIEFSGALGMKVSMIPSEDLMVVRLGFQPSIGEWERAVYSKLLPGVQPSK